MAITAIGATFERIRQTEGEAAAQLWLWKETGGTSGRNDAGPLSMDPLVFHAGRGFLDPLAQEAAGPAPSAQAIFTMVTRVNQRVSQLAAKVTAGQIETHRAFAAMLGLHR